MLHIFLMLTGPFELDLIVGYNVDHDEKGKAGSSAFQENAISSI